MIVKDKFKCQISRQKDRDQLHICKVILLRDRISFTQCFFKSVLKRLEVVFTVTVPTFFRDY